MNEQPPQDQAHGYNEKAIDAIAAMPRDANGTVVPNEEAYRESQKNVESDPMATKRSDNMEQWSDAIGSYADRKAGLQTVLEETVDDQAVKDKVVRSTTNEPIVINSKLVQASPVVPAYSRKNSPLNMHTQDAFGGTKYLDSPVTIGNVQRPKDIEGAQLKKYVKGVQEFNDDLKAVDAAKNILK